MRILVAYASKHGATAGIADRIGMELRCAGSDVDVLPIDEVGAVEQYDAYVIGSAVYVGSWMKLGLKFVQQHAPVLSARPLWLFSSGPLGSGTTDDEGNDLRETTRPKQHAELEALLRPREHRIFFGALDRSGFGLSERLIAAMPGSDKLLPEGDFRDWADIEAWAQDIAAALEVVPTM
ncbi:MAG: hypothetical protein M9890_00465 [Thermomicrobiales bacterium]|nr:hypothetical protein [Thermomicrobiales bacterium]